MQQSSRIFSTEDARWLAQRRLPKLVFDFVEGAAGREVGTARNVCQFDNVMLQPRVMADVAQCSLATTLMGKSYKVPFGIAPMGMCNLVHPKADASIAKAATAMDFPMCLSSAASTSIEDMASMAGLHAWFQLYFGGSQEASLAMVERAQMAGYDTLILTVDVPQVSRRVRDLRNGFTVPFAMTPRAFLDFATHPSWSLSTLTAGAPRPMNFTDSKGSNTFDRGANRSGADWAFLEILRDKWQGKLVVKGVTSAADASRVHSLGADAIYVSNHGGRQLDSVPPSIQLLPLIRAAVGPEFPLLFDSGIRNGEDIVKALAFGADFVMLGRPALFALGAEGAVGLNALLTSFVTDITVVMAQLGIRAIDQLGSDAIFDGKIHNHSDPETKTQAALRLATKP
ncbi:MAG: alpha-hydroxy acid oxidase [Planktomarina sp.]|jgi:isopentenyl diphosphate isomerase/L-lactate dehydrogenase-like FMN-dependent dehydrogenase|nr:alpha-hydroxy acid oxidase [Planktomarina sp.]